MVTENEMKQFSDVVQDILEETSRQVEKGYTNEHCDSLTAFQWAGKICAYAAWAQEMDNQGSPDKCRRRLMQVATMAIRACEAYDRKNQN